MAESKIPVLIVGAGPAGLTAALVLLKNKVPVRIIDKDSEFHVGSRGSGTQCRTTEFMQFLGILQDVEDISTEVPKMKLYKLPGGTETLKTWDLIEDVPTTPSAPFKAGKIRVAQDEFEGILRNYVKKYGCEVELGTELMKFEQDADGVTAWLRHVDTGKEEIVRADFLIGADGARGVVRKQLGLTFSGETRDAEAMIVGDVDLKGLDRDHWHFWDNSDVGVLIRPTTRNENLFNVGVVLRTGDAAPLAQPKALVDYIHRSTERPELQFGEFKWLSYFRPNMRMVNKFGEGRVFVAGDAAHVHSPTGGQGLNTSMQDSLNLSWKIALVHRGLAPLILLESYNAERIPVVAEMLRQTTGLYTGLVHAQPGTSTTTAWQRSRTLFMLGINYRWSDIVLEGRTPVTMDKEVMKANSYGGYDEGLCAGDRAPEAPGLVVKYAKEGEIGKETSLFQLFDLTKHTILLFPEQSCEEDIKSMFDAIASLPSHIIQTIVLGDPKVTLRWKLVDKLVDKVDFILWDKINHAREGYLVKSHTATLFIIRPDTYIGATIKDAEGVKAYFQMVLF